jgi:hypothetical protein
VPNNNNSRAIDAADSCGGEEGVHECTNQSGALEGTVDPASSAHSVTTPTAPGDTPATTTDAATWLEGDSGNSSVSGSGGSVSSHIFLGSGSSTSFEAGCVGGNSSGSASSNTSTPYNAAYTPDSMEGDANVTKGDMRADQDDTYATARQPGEATTHPAGDARVITSLNKYEVDEAEAGGVYENAAVAQLCVVASPDLCCLLCSPV